MPLKLQRAFLFLVYAIPLALILGRAPADILMCSAIFGFLIHSIMIRDFSWLRTPWFKLTIITWLYMILSSLLALYDVHSALVRSIEWIRYPLFTIAFSTWLVPLDKGFVYLRRSLVILLPLVALDAILQFVTGHDIFGYKRTIYMGRLTGPFGVDNMVVGLFLGRLIWPVTGLLFAFILQQRNFWKHNFLLPLSFMLLVGLAILLSGERMPFLLFITAAGFFCLGARNIRKTVFAASGTFLVVAILLVTMCADLHERFVTYTAPALENFDQSSYGAILENAITAWKLAPVTGIGPKNFFAACTVNGIKGGFRDEATWSPTFNCAHHPHNPYLEWLTETGVIGLALFLALIGLWLKDVRHNLKNTTLSGYYTALGFAVGLVPFLWPVMSTTSFFINWSVIIFWWVLGLNLGLNNTRKIEASANS